jgi:hypothetical protein
VNGHASSPLGLVWTALARVGPDGATPAAIARVTGLDLRTVYVALMLYLKWGELHTQGAAYRIRNVR